MNTRIPAAAQPHRPVQGPGVVSLIGGWSVDTYPGVDELARGSVQTGVARAEVGERRLPEGRFMRASDPVRSNQCANVKGQADETSTDSERDIRDEPWTCVAMTTQALSASSTSSDGNKDKFVYAVPVLCGFGSTNVNVHNPKDRAVTLTKKTVPLDFGQVPTPPRVQPPEILKSDWAFLMSCDDIAAMGGVGSAGSGDVIIESTQELNVWAIYTHRSPEVGSAKRKLYESMPREVDVNIDHC
jgi:hypothetical protein